MCSKSYATVNLELLIYIHGELVTYVNLEGSFKASMLHVIPFIDTVDVP